LKASSFYTTPGDLKADILDGGRSFKWVPLSVADDDGGITIIQIPGKDTGRFERIFTGPVRADEVSIKSDGSNQTSSLNSLAANVFVKEIVIDNGDVTVNGDFNAQGKRIVFRNNARLIGSGSVQNAYIEASNYVQVFDTTLNTDGGILNPGGVSVKWWGAKADFVFGGAYSQGQTNNRKAFTRATVAVKNRATFIYYRAASRLYIPSGADIDHLYYLDSTWTIDRNIEVYGDGMDVSGLVFPHGVVGIHVQGVNSSDTTVKGGANAFLHDFKLWGNNTQSDWTFDDGKSFGILIQQNKSTYQRVMVEGFGSNGFYVFAHVPESNANNCFFSDCVSYYNGGFGWKAKSTDVNKCVMLKGDLSYNVRGGYCDSSFLGNSLYDVHTASNVVISPHNKAFVTYLGNRFVCKTDALDWSCPACNGRIKRC
jgi:hypothetical protein